MGLYLTTELYATVSVAASNAVVIVLVTGAGVGFFEGNGVGVSVGLIEGKVVGVDGGVGLIEGKGFGAGVGFFDGLGVPATS